MVTTLAHESRNALQRIFSAVEMLQLDLQASPDSLRDVGQVERAAHDLQELLDEVRSYAAPLQLERSETDLGQLWQTAWRQVVTSRGLPQLQLVEERPPVPLLGRFDRFRLEQVFRNLFENALAACPSEPRVHLRCDHWGQAPGGYWRISLCDNGPGVAAPQRRRLFEPFYTTKRHGTGLGLVIVKRIIEAHGGSVQFAPNQHSGAKLRVILPCLPQP
jgi:signal transduction histidine kinase